MVEMAMVELAMVAGLARVRFFHDALKSGGSSYLKIEYGQSTYFFFRVSSSVEIMIGPEVQDLASYDP